MTDNPLWGKQKANADEACRILQEKLEAEPATTTLNSGGNIVEQYRLFFKEPDKENKIKQAQKELGRQFGSNKVTRNNDTLILDKDNMRKSDFEGLRTRQEVMQQANTHSTVVSTLIAPISSTLHRLTAQTDKAQAIPTGKPWGELLENANAACNILQAKLNADPASTTVDTDNNTVLVYRLFFKGLNKETNAEHAQQELSRQFGPGHVRRSNNTVMLEKDNMPQSAFEGLRTRQEVMQQHAAESPNVTGIVR